MIRYIVGRVALALAVLLTVSLIVFLASNVATDPARALAGEGARPEDIAAVRKNLQLDRPLLTRYAIWLQRSVTGDFGESYRLQQPVSEVIRDRLKVTLTLGACALTFAILLAIPLGIAAAARPGTLLDRLALTIAVVGQAMPTFWFGLLLMLLFGVNLGWLPVSGSETWLHFILPTIALGYYATPELMRLTRAGMLDVLSSDYIRAARARGNSELRILLKHALRPAILPVVSVAAVQFGIMLSGSVVIETLFALRGIGFLAWESIIRGDLPVLQAIVLVVSGIYMVLNLGADVLNAVLDPRMRRT